MTSIVKEFTPTATAFCVPWLLASYGGNTVHAAFDAVQSDLGRLILFEIGRGCHVVDDQTVDDKITAMIDVCQCDPQAFADKLHGTPQGQSIISEWLKLWG